MVKTRLPDFPRNAIWLNDNPLSVSRFRGQVVVLYFWDFTDIASTDMLPYLRAWQRRYEGLPVRIVSVLAPEHEFGHSYPIAQTAVESLQLPFPVLYDPSHRYWRRFERRAWPSVYVADADGTIAYEETGQFSFAVVEAVVQDLLRGLVGPDVALPEPVEALRPVDEPGMPLWPVTPDFITGFEGGALGNAEGYELHRVVEYSLPPREQMEPGKFYLGGKWLNQRHCVSVAKAESPTEAEVVIPYVAASVALIVHPAGEMGFAVEVTDNDKPMTRACAGAHVRIEGRGRNAHSYLVVTDTKAYRVVERKSVRSGLLRLRTRSSGFALYGVSFLSSPYCDGQPPSPVVENLITHRAAAKHSVLEPPRVAAAPQAQTTEPSEAEAPHEPKETARKTAKRAKGDKSTKKTAKGAKRAREDAKTGRSDEAVEPHPETPPKATPKKTARKAAKTGATAPGDAEEGKSARKTAKGSEDTSPAGKGAGTTTRRTKSAKRDAQTHEKDEAEEKAARATREATAKKVATKEAKARAGAGERAKPTKPPKKTAKPPKGVEDDAKTDEANEATAPRKTTRKATPKGATKDARAGTSTRRTAKSANTRKKIPDDATSKTAARKAARASTSESSGEPKPDKAARKAAKPDVDATTGADATSGPSPELGTQAEAPEAAPGKRRTTRKKARTTTPRAKEAGLDATAAKPAAAQTSREVGRLASAGPTGKTGERAAALPGPGDEGSAAAPASAAPASTRKAKGGAEKTSAASNAKKTSTASNAKKSRRTSKRSKQTAAETSAAAEPSTTASGRAPSAAPRTSQRNTSRSASATTVRRKRDAKPPQQARADFLRTASGKPAQVAAAPATRARRVSDEES